MNQAGKLPVSTPKRKSKTKTDTRTEWVVHMPDNNLKNELQVLKQLIITVIFKSLSTNHIWL